MEKNTLKTNVILVDAGYADVVAGNLSAHFSQRMGRQLPSADLAEWLVCLAKDSGMEEGGEKQVIFVCPERMDRMGCFVPSTFCSEIDGQAFRDEIMGEFLLSCVRDEALNNGSPLIEECIRTILSEKTVRRLAVVCADVTCRECLNDISYEPTQHVLFQLSMEPSTSEGVESLSLGYSLLHALGILPEDIEG